MTKEDMLMNIQYRDFNLRTGKKIKNLRIEKQLTREHLAELAEISTKFLYEIEIGKKGCSAYVLYRLARSLTVSADFLISE